MNGLRTCGGSVYVTDMVRQAGWLQGRELSRFSDELEAQSVVGRGKSVTQGTEGHTRTRETIGRAARFHRSHKNGRADDGAQRDGSTARDSGLSLADSGVRKRVACGGVLGRRSTTLREWGWRLLHVWIITRWIDRLIRAPSSVAAWLWAVARP